VDDFTSKTALAPTAAGISFEQTRLLRDGGYCLAAFHPAFEQPVRFTITHDGEGWQISAWVMTQTRFDDETWSFPQLEATPLVGQASLESVLKRVAPHVATDQRVLADWVFEISAALSRVLRYVTVYDAVGCAHRRAA
jgi:hypothetical protein